MATDVHRYNVQIGGFNVSEAGDYEVLVEQRAGAEWTTVSVLPVYVQLVSSPVTAAASVPPASSPAAEAPSGASALKIEKAPR
jgi:hypothetical protein